MNLDKLDCPFKEKFVFRSPPDIATMFTERNQACAVLVSSSGKNELPFESGSSKYTGIGSKWVLPDIKANYACIFQCKNCLFFLACS